MQIYQTWIYGPMNVQVGNSFESTGDDIERLVNESLDGGASVEVTSNSDGELSVEVDGYMLYVFEPITNDEGDANHALQTKQSGQCTCMHRKAGSDN